MRTCLESSARIDTFWFCLRLYCHQNATPSCSETFIFSINIRVYAALSAFEIYFYWNERDILLYRCDASLCARWLHTTIGLCVYDEEGYPPPILLLLLSSSAAASATSLQSPLAANKRACFVRKFTSYSCILTRLGSFVSDRLPNHTHTHAGGRLYQANPSHREAIKTK